MTSGNPAGRCLDRYASRLERIRPFAAHVAMALARNHPVSRSGFLLESVFILRIEATSENRRGSWLRAASRSTSSSADNDATLGDDEVSGIVGEKRGRIMKHFTAVIERDADTGLYVGWVPGFPGAHSQGETLDELHVNLREVVEMLLEDGDPKFASVFVGTQTVDVA